MSNSRLALRFARASVGDLIRLCFIDQRSNSISDASLATHNSLFLLSFRQRDELAVIVERAGWEPIAARRVDKAERRFILSGASIAIVDARGAFDEGLAAVRMLADPVDANGAALLVLVSRGEIERVDAMFSAGATHFLASPFGEQEFLQSLRFAERFTQRLGRTFQHIDTASETDGKQALNWSLGQDSDDVTLSAPLAQLLGIDSGSESVSRSRFLATFGEVGAREGGEAIARLRASNAPTAFAHDLPNRPGERLAHHLSPPDESGRIAARVEQPDRPVETKALGLRDYLTGLGDARKARLWIEEQLARAGEADPQFTLLLFSLHRFDMVNAAFGQHAGDAALQGMARRIEKLVGPMPGRKRLIARLAGAEFAVGLAAPTSLEEAEFLARQLAVAVEQPFVSGDQVIRVRMRCGIVSGGVGDEDAASVLRRASAALAGAREGEGRAIRVQGAAEENDAARANRLEIDLRPALNQDEIEILFQPQVSVTTGAIVGVEALARWRHPVFGELGATSLFAAAERSDYLAELSAHVQAKAARIAAQWPSTLAGIRLAINVTAAEMAEPDFADRFATMIDVSGFPRDRLTAEITESGLIEDLGAAADRLAALRAGGFRVAIDDFGTGYSSLAYLKSLPLDYLKIDRRLSQDITGSARDRIVVSGAIEMARSLGLTVIAEGVETEEQLALLAEQGCSLYQGFLCSPPINNAALIELLGKSAG